MNESDVYNSVCASLLKYCKDFIAENSTTQSFRVHDFDAFASENELPVEDLVGICEYSIENMDRHYITTVMFVVCTTAEDDALQKLRPVVGRLFGKLKPGSGEIQVVDATSGSIMGNLTVMDSVKVLPVARTDTRPVQMIAVSFASSFLTPP